MQTTCFTIYMTQDNYNCAIREPTLYVPNRNINEKRNLTLGSLRPAYDDILEASDRLRRWYIDPSKNLKYDLHLLSQLIERVNKTSQHDIADSQILAIIYKEILKGPREGLRVIAHNSSINKTRLNDVLNILNGSSYVLPFNSKVKFNELIRNIATNSR